MRATLLLLLMTALGCDGGLAPPAERAPGAIRGVVRYGPPDGWPPPDSLVDLRFVAMRFVPRDTADFLNLNALVFTPQRLALYVARDSFVIGGVEPGRFLYSGVAQRFSSDLLDWRPVGLYTANGGIFDVAPGETTFVDVTVDFRSPPLFPPR